MYWYFGEMFTILKKKIGCDVMWPSTYCIYFYICLPWWKNLWYIQVLLIMFIIIAHTVVNFNTACMDTTVVLIHIAYPYSTALSKYYCNIPPVLVLSSQYIYNLCSTKYITKKAFHKRSFKVFSHMYPMIISNHTQWEVWCECIVLYTY